MSAPYPRVERRRQRGLVPVPAVTFLVGLLLGGAVVWAGLSPGSGGSASGPPSPRPSATVTVRPSQAPTVVPQACVRAGRSAGQVLTLVRQAADALGSLEAQRLQQLAARAQQLEQQVRADVQACQAAAQH